MKLLIVPDIHLGKSANLGKEDLSGNNSRIEDQKKLLYFTLEQAKENNVERIILTGDVFDHFAPKPNLVVLFMEWLTQCRKYCYVDIILGNHDFVKSDKNLNTILDCVKFLGCNLFKKVMHLEDTSQVIIQPSTIKITYLPYTDRRLLGKETIQEATDHLTDLIKESVKPGLRNVLIGHLSLQGSFFTGDEVEDDSNEIFLPIDIFSDYDAVFMGHVHKYQVISSTPLIMHVGSLDKTSFTEGPKYLVIYDSDTNEIQDIELPTRNLVDFNIVIPADADQTKYVLDQINTEDIKDSIVRLKIETNSIDSTVDRKQILKLLEKKNIHNLSSFTETRRNEKPIAKNTELDETIDHNKAIDMGLALLKADDSFKKDVAAACKDIVNSKE